MRLTRINNVVVGSQSKVHLIWAALFCLIDSYVQLKFFFVHNTERSTSFFVKSIKKFHKLIKIENNIIQNAYYSDALNSSFVIYSYLLSLFI